MKCQSFGRQPPGFIQRAAVHIWDDFVDRVLSEAWRYIFL
jgi:hypothetical protein